jgi:hypothetical protein
MDISPTQRLHIAARYTFDSTPAMVNTLQELYNRSRQDIYTITTQALEAFHPPKPGPKPDPVGTLQARVTALEIQNQTLRDQVAAVEQQLAYAGGVDKRRIEDFILTALVTPPTHAGIAPWVAVVYGEQYQPNPSMISRLTSPYGTVAGLILRDERITSHFQTASADEIFFSRTLPGWSPRFTPPPLGPLRYRLLEMGTPGSES